MRAPVVRRARAADGRLRDDTRGRFDSPWLDEPVDDL